ncbi:MAG: hypothetical protein AAF416_10245 [Pseudomonadota bacterium]
MWAVLLQQRWMAGARCSHLRQTLIIALSFGVLLPQAADAGAPQSAPLPSAAPRESAAPAQPTSREVPSTSATQPEATSPSEGRGTLTDRAATLEALTALLRSPEARSIVVPTSDAENAEFAETAAPEDATAVAAPEAMANADPQEGQGPAIVPTAADTPKPIDDAPAQAEARQTATLSCLDEGAVPAEIWTDLRDRAALAGLSAGGELARDGPESGAELRRLAQAADAIIRRPSTPAMAAIYAGMLPDCPLVSDTERFVDAAAEAPFTPLPPHEAEAEDDGEETVELHESPLGEASDWRRFLERFQGAPDALREELAFRLAAHFIEMGHPAGLSLIEPYAVSSTAQAAAMPRRALITAELDIARGAREVGLDGLRRLAGPRSPAEQSAAILLAERLEPGLDAPIRAGWLAHIDLLGSISLEGAGTARAERAAMGEVRLAQRVLGPAEALRRLALSHDRGLIATSRMAQAARSIRSGDPIAGRPPIVSLEVLAAHQPESFESIDRHAPEVMEAGYGPSEAGTRRAEAALRETAVTPDPRSGGSSTAGSAPVRRASAGASPPDWRALVSAAGATPVGGAGATETAVAAAASEPTSSAGANRADATRRGTTAAQSLNSFDAGSSEISEEMGPRDALLDDIERFLEITGDDIDAAEALLDDG